jgi:hypothetical protein
MNRCEDIQAAAIALAALPRTAPEVEAATSHAAGCADCALALAAGARMLSAVDAESPPPAPSAAALERAVAPVLAAMRADRARAHVWARLGAALTAGCVALSVILAFSMSHPQGYSEIATWICFPAELICASLPFSVVFLGLSRRAVARTPLAMAGVAAAGALAGQLTMHVLCTGHDLRHLLVLHTGGVLISALVGWVGTLPRARAHAVE